jgi:hypothetical protein
LTILAQHEFWVKIVGTMPLTKMSTARNFLPFLPFAYDHILYYSNAKEYQTTKTLQKCFPARGNLAYGQLSFLPSLKEMGLQKGFL